MPNLLTSVGERRIELWRRAIFLFDKTQKDTGPFREAGYKQYWCEGKSVEKLTPDIFGFSDRYFCVCDISMSPQKNVDMEKYNECNPSEYMLELFPSELERKSAGNPFLITDELEVVKYPGYNLIQVIQPGGATLEDVDDPVLEDTLIKWQGFINPPPSYSISAVPESSIEELKSPLSGIFKWAAYQDRNITIDDVLLRLLGDLYDSLSQRGRATLKKKIKDIIVDLSKGHLKNFLFYHGDINSFSIKIEKDSEASRNAFSGKINDWVKILPIERYWTEEEFEDED